MARAAAMRFVAVVRACVASEEGRRRGGRVVRPLRFRHAVLVARPGDCRPRPVVTRANERENSKRRKATCSPCFCVFSFVSFLFVWSGLQISPVLDKVTLRVMWPPILTAFRLPPSPTRGGPSHPARHRGRATLIRCQRRAGPVGSTPGTLSRGRSWRIPPSSSFQPGVRARLPVLRRDRAAPVDVAGSSAAWRVERVVLLPPRLPDRAGRPCVTRVGL